MRAYLGKHLLGGFAETIVSVVRKLAQLDALFLDQLGQVFTILGVVLRTS